MADRGWCREELAARKLPELLKFQDGRPVRNAGDWKERRTELGEILSRDFAGFPVGLAVRQECQILRREQDFGGKAVTEYRELRLRTDFSSGTFPFTITFPQGRKDAPAFLFLSFTPEIAGGIGEEILDAGYTVANLYYQDVVADYFDGHMTGLGQFCVRNPFDSWGKLRIWAWAVSRILDVILEEELADRNRIAVMGHSRLGKAALIAGAFDTRFSLTVSCQSGGGGAALFRGKKGEQIENLYGQGTRLWFDGNFFSYLGRTQELPFDQHFLLAMAAPRHLYVSSAAEDDWSDPASEFLCCKAASPAYSLLGETGLEAGDSMPEPGEAFHDGRIGYHLRAGTHFLSREDWKLVMAYRKRHGV